MASTPFTSGKNSEGPKSPGGMFRKGTGGHTSRGVHRPAGNTAASTSNDNTRIGGLKKRMTGAGGGKGMPK